MGIRNGFQVLDVCDSHYLIGKTRFHTQKNSDYTFVSANSELQWGTGVQFGQGMSAAHTFG